MKRREFITLLGGAAAGWPLAARAQQRQTMPVIGALYGVSAAEWTPRTAEFRRGLSDAGFEEGRNVAIEYRWANGQFDRLPAMAADLVGRKVAVIFAGASDVATRAAMSETRTIPIVFTTGTDPVAAGLVASLNRPGGNVTGVTNFNSELGSKRLELLHEIIRSGTKIALLVNPNNAQNSGIEIEGARTAARRLGLEFVVLSASTENDIERAFLTALQQGAAALSVSPDAYLNSRHGQIAFLGLRHALPTISGAREAAVAGQLMSYGSNQLEAHWQAGTYVGRILKGEKPADLPVMQPTRFELIVNLKTAKAIGLTISESFLALADEVIE
jgi:putative ABC transport system substrate-binding protein